MKRYALNAQQKRTIIYGILLLALLSLLVAATYTWLSLSSRVSISGMELNVTTPAGLELATTFDAEEWSNLIAFPELVTETSPLKPATWSQARQRFLTVTYGLDGRLTDQWLDLTDSANANHDSGDGYYVVGTFYVKSGESCEVSLAEAVEVNNGENGAGTYVIGTPVWNTERLLHSDGGNGAEMAVRLGFRVSSLTSDGQIESSTFTIYEPNCDTHVNGETGYVETPSVDGTETLSSRLILQTASSWTEAYPVQREVTVKSLGRFLTDAQLFTLLPGETKRIDLYVWLEGQDQDCVNYIEPAQIFANIQFHADFEGQSGMAVIPNA